MNQIIVNFYSKYKLIIFPIIVAIASLILMIFVIFPQIKEFLDSQTKISQEKKRILSLEVKASDLTKVNDEEIENKLKYSLKALPPDQDFTAIIGIFQRLAVGAGVTLSSLQLGSSQIQIPSTSGFAVKMEVEGSGSGIALFLSGIDKSPRSMKVEVVEISKGQGGNLTGSVLVDVFFAATPKELGEVDKELPKFTADDEKILQEIAGLAPEFSGISATDSDIVSEKGKENPFE